MKTIHTKSINDKYMETGACPPAGKLVGPADHFSALYSPPAIFSPRGVPGHPLHTPWLRPCMEIVTA